MTYDPVLLARQNIETWSATTNRRGESSHWRGFNPRITGIKDLSNFRAVNASGEDVRLGLDGTRTGDSNDTRKVFKHLVEKWGFELVNPLLESRIGNPPVTKIESQGGHVCDTDFNDLHLVNFALEFSRAHSVSGRGAPTRILEIGGGYGGTSAKIAALFPSTSFVFTDLPPACLLQTYYLNELFPGQVAVVPLGEDMTYEHRSKRFVICPSGDINEFLDSCDGAINTRAFGEMNRGVVKDYFTLIQSKIGVDGIFMNVNRLQKMGYLFSDYPYDNQWKVISSEPAFEQTGLWSLITQRTASKNRGFSQWKADIPIRPPKNVIEKLKYRLFGLR